MYESPNKLLLKGISIYWMDKMSLIVFLFVNGLVVAILTHCDDKRTAWDY